MLGFNLLFFWLVYTSDLNIPQQPTVPAMNNAGIIIIPCECPDGIPAYLVD
jgi:hypothetical protein